MKNNNNNNNNNNSFSSSNNNNNNDSNNSINSLIKNNNNSDNSFHSTITNNKSKTFQNKKIYNINSNKNNNLIDNINNHFTSKTYKNKRNYDINPESKIINLNNSNIISLNTTRPSIQYNSNTNPNKNTIINNNLHNNNKEINTTINSNNNSLYNKINSQNNLFHANTSSNNLSFSTFNTPCYKNNNYVQNSFLNEYAFENGKWINNNNITNDKSLNEDFLVEQNSIAKLRDYLISCDLINYLNLFLENEIIDIEKLIEGVKKNELKIEYKDIEDLGIKKPGHIFRFLLKIEIDSKLINENIVDFVFNNLNSKKNDLNVSLCYFKPCCNLGKNNSYTKYNDIFTFLQSKNLEVLKDNLLHNGFDSIEFLFIQMFSKYSFNDEMLTEYFHIYKDELKRKFLKEMYKEKKKIYNILKIPYYEKFFYKNESLELNSENEENCNMCNII